MVTLVSFDWLLLTPIIWPRLSNFRPLNSTEDSSKIGVKREKFTIHLSLFTCHCSSVTVHLILFMTLFIPNFAYLKGIVP